MLFCIPRLRSAAGTRHDSQNNNNCVLCMPFSQIHIENQLNTPPKPSHRSISNQLINHFQLIFIPPASTPIHFHHLQSTWACLMLLLDSPICSCERHLMQVRCKETLLYLFKFEREIRFIWDKWPLKSCLPLYSISQNKSQLLSFLCRFYYPNWLFFLSELTKQQSMDRGFLEWQRTREGLAGCGSEVAESDIKLSLLLVNNVHILFNIFFCGRNFETVVPIISVSWKIMCWETSSKQQRSPVSMWEAFRCGCIHLRYLLANCAPLEKPQTPMEFW